MIEYIIISLFVFDYCWVIWRKANKKTSSIDLLKNALLSHALMNVSETDCDNMKYYKFDGGKLPMFSGSDVSFACFSYIIDKNQFVRSPWYTKNMFDKLLAIDKYIDKNLDTNEKVKDFFEQYLNKIHTNTNS